MTTVEQTRSSARAHARAIADAVLYEGYLLYPYRASSAKNHARWQFGVAGPRGAEQSGIGEPAELAADCVVRGGPNASLTLSVRFLQLQRRAVEAADAGAFRAVERLDVDGRALIGWDEASECETRHGPFSLSRLASPVDATVQAPAGARRRTSAHGVR